MNKILQILLLGLLSLQIACTQTVDTNRPGCANTAFDEKVAGTISFSVPLIGVETLAENPEAWHIFDTRKRKEFETSRIPGAKYLGYRDFNTARLNELPFDAPIVLYCSIGYRSEKIGEKLQKLGYTNVYNLYGSIFEWVNRDHIVIDNNGKETNLIHTYNRSWSRWVEDGKAVKVW